MSCELLDEGNFSTRERQVLARAARILESKVRAGTSVMNSPSVVRQWLRLRFSGLEREMFGVLFLDAQNRFLDFDVLFAGTLTQTSVFPREVVKAALARNAAAVMFVHNHPSGCAEPSQADQLITEELKRALSVLDTKVLDHFIVGGSSILSFAERGLI